jgi:ABC-type spermidine/putrescine transport system permease subunit II
MIKHGATPVINALSTLLLVVTFGVVLLAQRLTEEKNA